MNYANFFGGISLALLCFVLGAHFHAGMGPPEREVFQASEPAVREPAAAAQHYDHRATEAFKGCIDSRIKNNSLGIGKVVVEGRKWSIVSVACTGEHAKDLYDSIQPYSTEEYVHYRDGRRGVVRFFGRLFPPSQCVQLIGSVRGKETNEYSCSIRIDVDHEITEQLKL
jgi:hypothetical protein